MVWILDFGFGFDFGFDFGLIFGLDLGFEFEFEFGVDAGFWEPTLKLAGPQARSPARKRYCVTYG